MAANQETVTLKVYKQANKQTLEPVQWGQSYTFRNAFGHFKKLLNANWPLENKGC